MTVLRNGYGGAGPPEGSKRGYLHYTALERVSKSIQGAIMTYAKSCVKSRLDLPEDAPKFEQAALRPSLLQALGGVTIRQRIFASNLLASGIERSAENLRVELPNVGG